MVRDEADIIAYTLSHLLAEGIDEIIVADNLSDDDTRQILEMYAERYPVTVLDDNDPGYCQDVKMTNLARIAADDHGADWILPFDADELFYWDAGTLAEFFDLCAADVVTASGWDHVATDDDDPAEANPFERITCRRPAPQKFGKVAFRPYPGARLDYGNHFILDHPGRAVRGLNLRHFQYRSFDQMLLKVRQGTAAVRVAELSGIYATHWRELDNLDDNGIFTRWRRLCEEPGLIFDPAPWRAP